MSPNAPGLPNPPGWRDVCAANGVTDQGLGEESAANGAGNAVLCEVEFCTYSQGCTNVVFKLH
ncbi:MAG: hypothetical protein JW384_00290 [Nitrosomonadaceae bacterium]|nr:hypothetical protein [Nitrosomonadaceae bacterium]